MSSTPEADLQAWPGHTGNWHRWANDLGTLNLITPDVVLRATQEVRKGIVIACSRPLTGDEVAPHPTDEGPAVTHVMGKADECGFDQGDLTQSAADTISFRVHGMTNTHIDALSHMGYRGRTFNEYAFPDVVSMAEGAKRMDITSSLGIVTRGIFVDVPFARGVEYLSPGDSVLVSDIEKILDEILPGDAVVIRTGGTLASGSGPEGDTWHHGTWAGLDTDVVEVLAEHDVSMICTDSPGDTYPHRHEEYCRSPVHVLSEVFYGMPLVHSLDAERLAEVCADEKQHKFMFFVSALNLPTATGTLTTPVAVL